MLYILNSSLGSTRSDILLQTTYLSSFCGHATTSHVHELNRIFHYLATTINKSIIIKRSSNDNIKLELYADAGHIVVSLNLEG